MEAQLLVSRHRDALRPVGSDRSDNDIIPSIICDAAVVHASLAAMPDPAPESVGFKFAPDEREHVESREIVNRHVEGDNSGACGHAGVVDQSARPENRLPMERRRVETPAEAWRTRANRRSTPASTEAAWRSSVPW